MPAPENVSTSTLVIALLLASLLLALLVGACRRKGSPAPEQAAGTSDASPGDPQQQLLAVLQGAGIRVAKLAIHRTGPAGTIYRVDVPARRAIATWERLRPLVDKMRHYPVVCRDEAGALAELLEFNEGTPAQSVQAARQIDVAQWFTARAASDREYYDEVTQGEWKPSPPQRGWSVPFELDGRTPAKDVWIALVPTMVPWEVLAHFHYGDWNECPPTPVHIAILRSWHERFGAEVVCVSFDVLEMRVARPPTDRAGALALAREQFLYTGGDLIYQGHGSMAALGAALVGADYWFFWWD